MRPAVWQAYMRWQTEWAYGADPYTGYCEPTLALAGARLPQMGAKGPLLVVGGGHPLELDVLARIAEPLWLLSAHPPEIASVRARGFRADLGDVHDMPYESGSVGLIFTSNVLEHVFAPYIALMEMRRVIRSDGLAYHGIPEFEGPECGVGEFHLHCLTEPVWRELLNKAGWQLTSSWASAPTAISIASTCAGRARCRCSSGA